MKTVSCFAVIWLAWLSLIQGKPTLLIQSPEGPVLESQSVTLECVSDVDSDMSFYSIQKYSRYMMMWINLEKTTHLRCWYYDVNVTRADGRLQLNIPSIQSWNSGSFRCVANNATNEESISEELNIPVHYLRDISIYRDSSFYSRYWDQLGVMNVTRGSDVEVECSASASETPSYTWSKQGLEWVQLSNKLKLQKVQDDDAGLYTCTVQHPTVPSLSKNRSFQLYVVNEKKSWLGPDQMNLILMTAVPAGVLLLIILILAVYLSKRKAPIVKGPIDDHSQKKPIYTGSQESLPSAGDTQPLV
ncbi:LOW QUALITY PROTEIN: basal cell adhesion molecule [Erpetoichthys calabaricus]|uniref:Basal cell adhesion molecule-like n=1 Tax=Erpetoichthys calabaricus TaxID=27687 RepID=A0A8C4TQU6_ERPCA|nr:LOW QUALITY PROTEIN: basal cell adhesion molecule [Erpetoichthys calabaricus]